MTFIEHVMATALGVAIPLLMFGLWLSSRLDWYLGEVVSGDLEKISSSCSSVAGNTSHLWLLENIADAVNKSDEGSK